MYIGVSISGEPTDEECRKFTKERKSIAFSFLFPSFGLVNGAEFANVFLLSARSLLRLGRYFWHAVTRFVTFLWVAIVIIQMFRNLFLGVFLPSPWLFSAMSSSAELLVLPLIYCASLCFF